MAKSMIIECQILSERQVLKEWQVLKKGHVFMAMNISLLQS